MFGFDRKLENGFHQSFGFDAGRARCGRGRYRSGVLQGIDAIEKIRPGSKLSVHELAQLRWRDQQRVSNSNQLII